MRRLQIAQLFVMLFVPIGNKLRSISLRGVAELSYSSWAMADHLALGDEIATLAAQLSVATHLLLTKVRQFDESEGWHRQGAQSCAHWLTWRIGLDPATAREKVRVARALGTLSRI